MRLFSYLFDRVILLSRHQHAPWYLAALSFAESSFFPVPPDVMLAPMALAKPRRAWLFASVTTLASVLGAIAGYILGYFAFALIVKSMITSYGYEASFQQVMQQFQYWGFWVIFVAGFSPLPYKLFTIAAGVLHMALLPFVIASAISRGARFYLVAGIMCWGGQRFEQVIRTWIDRIGWLLIVMIVISYTIHLGITMLASG